MNKKRKNLSSTLLSMVGVRPILFNPLFAQKPSNITNAIFLGQLLHWQSTKRVDEWFYKSVEEITEETTLSAYQQRSSVDFWSQYGVIEMEVRGMPPTRWFHVDVERVVGFVNSTSDRRIGVKKDGEKSLPWFDDLADWYSKKPDSVTKET